jgi:hypothetical protein
MLSPEDNNERQAIHEHDGIPLAGSPPRPQPKRRPEPTRIAEARP